MADEHDLRAGLAELGLEVTPDNVAQMAVFVKAMTIYQEREKKHLGLWKDQPLSDTLHHIHSKHARVRAQVVNVKDPDMDDALDLLNYTAFLVRRVEGAT